MSLHWKTNFFHRARRIFYRRNVSNRKNVAFIAILGLLISVFTAPSSNAKFSSALSVTVSASPSWTVGSTVSTSISNTISSGGGPAPSGTAYWFRCSSSVSALSNQTTDPSLSGCEQIGSAISLTNFGNINRSLTAADLDKFITVKIFSDSGDAGNPDRWAVAASSTAVSTGSFTNSAVPTLSGTSAVAGSLTTSNGTWSQTPDSYTYKWQVSDLLAGTYSDIAGATSSSFSPTEAELGKYVRSQVTAIKAGYNNNSANSAGSLIGAGTISNTAPPTVSGTLASGQTLTSTTGTWSPTPDSYSYQWQQSATLAGTYSDITGATSSTFVIQSAQAGQFVRVAVTASKTAYNNATANSTGQQVAGALTATTAIASRQLSQGVAATSFTPVTASGGVTPYQFSISPDLPSGLTLNTSTGAITGTPSVTSSAQTYTITVTDSLLATSSATTSIEVVGSVVATQVIASTSLTRNFAATSFTPVTASGGVTPYQFSISPALPSGLTLNTSTGAITGTPSVTSALQTYTITVTDANGATSSATTQIQVNEIVTVSGATSIGVALGSVTTSQYSAAGGTGDKTFSVSSSPASVGISISNSGLLTVDASTTAGNYLVTITATDFLGASGTLSVSLSVTSGVVATQLIVSTSLTVGRLATPFKPVGASNTSATVTYTISPALPAGLAITSTDVRDGSNNLVEVGGQITGTPTESRTATTYTITVSDGSSTASATTSITVNAAVGITGSNNLSATSGQAITSQYSATNGTAPFTFSIAGQPSGVSLNTASGLLTVGTSTASGTYNFTISVTDTNGSVAGMTITLTVAAGVAVTGAETITATTGTAKTSQYSSTGGTAPITFSLGEVTSGISITSAGLLTIAASVAQGSYTVTVRATDANGSIGNLSVAITVSSGITTTQVIASTALTQNYPAVAFTPVTASGGTGSLTYAISPTLPSGLSLNTATGEITGTPTATSAATTYTITVTDTNGATSSKTTSITVNAAITFTTTSGNSPTTIAATFGTAKSATYSVTGGTGTKTFSLGVVAANAGITINSVSGVLTIAADVPVGSYTATVTATDTLGATATRSVAITVNAALSLPGSSTVTVTSGTSKTVTYTATGGTTPYTYSLASAVTGVSINASTGVVTLATTVVNGSSYTVRVSDANSVTADLTVTITVAARTTISGSTAISVTSGTAYNTPAYVGANGLAPYTYQLVGETFSGTPVSINSTTGVVTIASVAVGNSGSTFTITATDANGSVSTNLTVTVTVNAAITMSGSATVAATAGVEKTSAYGASGGTGDKTFSVTNVNAGITINSSTGLLTVAASVPAGTYSVTVTATDTVGATGTLGVTITVNAAISISGSATLAATNGTAFTSSTYSATGGTGTKTFTLTGASAGITISSPSANNATIGVASSVAVGTYNVTIVATDTNLATASYPVTITVNTALSTTLAISSKTLTVGAAATFTPVTASGGTGSLTYSISAPAGGLPSGLTISSTTGEITGTPTATSSATNYTVRVQDANGVSSTKTFSMTIVAAVTTTVLVSSKSLTINQAANFTPVSASNGLTPYVYTISPSLPDGLSINSSTGAITGTPTATSAATTYAITATDANGSSSTANTAISVLDTVTAIVNFASVIVTAGRSSPTTPVSASGGAAPYTYTISPALPSGLSIAPSTGVISGAATSSLAISSFTVTITDNNGATANASFDLTINQALTTSLPSSAISFTVGFAVSSTPVTASGGTAPLTFAISTSLPSGLSFDTTSGLISGTPTTASPSASYTITVTDANGASSSRTFTLAVSDVVNIFGLGTVNATFGTAKTSSYTTTGGSAPIIFSLVETISGISINSSTGLLTIAATVPVDTYPVTVRATDVNGSQASISVSIIVNASVTVSAPSGVTSFAATAGKEYLTGEFTASGGVGAKSFSLTGAPSGITINSTSGVITVASTVAAGTYSITVVATDTNSATGSLLISITVNAAITVSGNTSITTAYTLPATSSYSASGGTGTKTFSLGVSAANAGITIDETTGVLTIADTVPIGTYTAIVTATDANSATGTLSVSIVVTPGVIATQLIASSVFTVNQPSVSIKPVGASNGISPYTYAISPALPTGLSLNPATGFITGVPTTASAATTYTITITDSSDPQTTASALTQITVNAAVSVSGSNTINSTTGIAKTSSYSASGGTGTKTFSLTGASEGITIDPSTGLVTVASSLTPATYTFTVVATDTNLATGSLAITLTVAAGVAVTGAETITATTGTAKTSQYSSTGGTAPITFSLGEVTSGISITSAGLLTIAASVAQGSYTVTVRATDANGSIGNLSVAITVSSGITTTQVIASTALTQNYPAVAFTPVTASGGTGSLTYAISPTLPSGLSLNTATGEITGTPTATSAATTYTITVTDTNGATSSKTTSITVNAAITFTTTSGNSPTTIAATFGTAKSATYSVTGGTGTKTFSLGVVAANAGITIDPSSGVLTIAADVPVGSYTATVTATDTLGATATRSVAITVNAAITVSGSDNLTATNLTTFNSSAYTASGGTGTKTFSLSGSSAGISINSSTGIITVANTVAVGSYSVTVIATDTNSATGSKVVSITVSSGITTTQVIASTALTQNYPAVAFTPVTASGGTGSLTYAISPTLPSGLSLNTATGEITGTPTATSAATTYTITVTDTNGATSSKTTSITVNAAITFTTTSGNSPTTIAATFGTAKSATYSVTGGTGTKTFSLGVVAANAGITIDPSSGVLTIAADVPVGSYTATVTATDTLGATATRSVAITVNAALSLPGSSTVTVTSGTSKTVTYTATGGTTPYTYSLASAVTGVSINASTGVVTLATTVVNGSSYTVRVSDANSVTADLTVTITVAARTTISGSTAISVTSGTAYNTPAYVGANGLAPYTYQLVGETFPGSPVSINSTTGVVTINSVGTSASGSTFTITATDANGSVSTNLTVTVTVNAAITFTTTSGNSPTTIAATFGTAKSATYSVTGGTGTKTFSLGVVAANAGITIDPSSGVLTIAADVPVGSYTATVTATDTLGATATRSVAITVNAALSLPGSSTVTVTSGTSKTVTYTATGGTTPYTYSLASAVTGVSINASTGVVTLATTVVNGSSYTVRVSDANSVTADLTVTITVNSALTTSLVISSTALTVSRSVSSTPVTASGGTAPLTFAISTSLPSGLSFDTTSGLISGTPTTASPSASYTITVTDANGASSSRTFTLAVSDVVNIFGLGTVNATFGTAKTSSYTTTGGSAPIIFSLVETISGISINSSTGLLTIAATVPVDTYPVTVRATDVNGSQASISVSIIVNASVTVSAPSGVTSFAATAGKEYLTGEFTASGGVGAKSFSLTGAPSGITINSTSGVITVASTVAAGTYSITVVATDTNSATGSLLISTTVNAAITVSGNTSITTAFTQSATSSYSASGGTGTKTFSLGVSAANAGITIDETTGVLTIADTVPIGTYTAIVTATDANSATGTLSVSIVVTPGVIATQLIASSVFTVNQPSVSIKPVGASNGISPYTYAISPALPTGLSLNPATGFITGVPTTASAATTYTITITDSSDPQTTASALTQITVNAAVSVSGSNTINSTTGIAKTSSYSASGGTGTKTFSLTGASEGITIDPSTGLVTVASSLTPATYTFTVVATDTNLATGSLAITLTVAAGVAVTGAETITATTGTAKTSQYSSTGGTAPITFSLGEVTSGISITSAGLLTIAASVAQGSYTVTVRATDANGSIGNLSVAITVSSGITTTQVIASTALTQNYPAVAFTPVTASGGTGSLTYAISPTLPSGLSLNTATGEITGTPTATSAATTYTITVTDTNGATSSKTTSITVNAAITFTTTSGNSPTTIAATFGTAKSATYSVTGGTGTKTFSLGVVAANAGITIDPSSGVLTIAADVPVGSYTATVTATDTLGATATRSVAITVNAALSLPGSSTVTVTSGTSKTVTYTATGGTTPYTYSLASAVTGVSINASTGVVTLATTVVNGSSYTVRVSDANSVTADLTVTITVAARTTISGSTAISVTSGTAYNTPAYVGANGLAPYTFQIVSQTLSGGEQVSVNSTTGVVTIPATLDAGTGGAGDSGSTFVIRATDANGSVSTNLTVTVTVNAAITMSGSATVAATAGVEKTSAYGASGGTGDKTFSVTNVNAGITINSSTGLLTVAASVPAGTYSVTVTATDTVGATGTLGVTITVNAAISISGSATLAATNGTAFTSSTYSATGGTGTKTFTLTGASAGITISSPSANNATIGVASSVAVGTYNVTIVATDTNLATASYPVTITVNTALSTTLAISSKTLTVGAAATFTPVTASGGTGSLTYSISAPAGGLPSGLTISSTTGEITGTPTATSSATNYTVRVQDANGVSSTKTFSMTIVAAVTTTVLVSSKSLTINQAANFTPVSASNGLTPYVYTISPSLPDGLSINSSTGAITGTPTATSAATTYAITATDANGSSSTANTWIIVNSAISTTLNLASLSWTLGKSSSYTPVSATGGTTPYIFSVNPVLPTGLTINSSNGSISGTANSAYATTTHQITVTDVNGSSSTQDVAITVNAAITFTAGPTEIISTSGTAKSATYSVTGGTGTKTFSLGVVAANAGITIDPASGVLTIAATVPAGSYTATVTATDENLATATQSVAITVNAAITFTAGPTEIISTSGTAKSATYSVTGGTGTKTFSLGVVAANAGITIDPASGLLTIAATVPAGSYTATVTATDENLATATQSVAITVNAAITFTTTSGNSPTSIGVTFGKSKSATYSVTGGTGTKTFSLGVVAANAGITIDPASGLLTIAATVPAGSYTATVTATDENLATATQSVAITVNAAITFTAGPTEIISTSGTAKSATYSVTGGTGTKTFSLGVVAANAGITIDPASGVLTIAATVPAGSYTATVTATDENLATATQSVAITVNAAITFTAGPTEIISTSGTAKSATYSVTGGTGTKTFSLGVVAANAGITIDPASGLLTIAATVPAGSYTATVTATDENLATATQSVAITVNAAITFTTTSGNSPTSIGVTFGKSKSATYSVTGGTGTKTFSLGVVAANAGITIDPASGLLTIAATVPAGSYTATVTATDENLATATQSVAITVNAAITFTTTSGNSPTSIGVTFGKSKSATYSVTGGTGTKTFSLGVVAANAGITIDPASGVLTIAATVPAGSYTATVTATDENLATAAQSVAITVNASVVATVVVPSISLVISELLSVSPVIGSLGTGSLTYSSPSLPLAGLSLDSSTGIVSGTANALVSPALTITVRVTDANGSFAEGSFTLVVLTNAPSISSLTPTTAAVGAFVEITGLNFAGTPSISTTGVSFNGTPAVFTVISRNLIRAEVPRRVTAGPITVTTSIGVATSSQSFTPAAAPSISSISPTTVPIGGTFVINGSGLLNTTEVRVGTVSVASFEVLSNSQVRATLPTSGVTTSTVSVLSSGLEATSRGSLTIVPAPALNALSPTEALSGATVTISGINLSTVDSVLFGATPATSFTINSATQISAVVPNLAPGINLVTVNSDGVSSNGLELVITASPTVSSATPLQVAIGGEILIEGANLLGVTSFNIAGTSANIVSNNGSQVRLSVAARTKSGLLTIVKAGVTFPTNIQITIVTSPSITSFSPTSVAIGGNVTIVGKNLQNTVRVDFTGGVSAAPTSVSATQVVVKVPSGAVTGPFTLLASGLLIQSGSILTVVNPPSISSVPTIANAGASITISGNNFIGTSAVRIGSISMTSFTVINATTIQATLSINATSGKISVTNAGFTAWSSGVTSINLQIISFTPTSGSPGTNVTITGRGFTPLTTVNVGSTLAKTTFVSSTTLIAVVPLGLSAGVVQISATNTLVTAPGSFTVTAGALAPTLARRNTFSPVSGGTGTALQISGTNLAGVSEVLVGGLNVDFAIVNSTTIVAQIASGTQSGLIEVRSPFGNAISTSTFTKIVGDVPPTITSLTPLEVSTGSIVTITGVNVGAAIDVRLNDVSIESFQVLSASSLSFMVPESASSGIVTVITFGGQVNSTSSITVV